MPRLRRFEVLGTEHSGCYGPIFAGLPPVQGRPFLMFVYVSLAGIGEQFVKLRGTVMSAGGVNAHDRRALHGLERPHVRHPGQRPRLRDLVRGRTYASAFLEVRWSGTGRQLGVPLVQIEDPRAKFSGSLRPAGDPLTRRFSAFHLLVVSHPGVFHKGQRSLFMTVRFRNDS
jgi:hypothetical protein